MTLQRGSGPWGLIIARMEAQNNISCTFVALVWKMMRCQRAVWKRSIAGTSAGPLESVTMQFSTASSRNCRKCHAHESSRIKKKTLICTSIIAICIKLDQDSWYLKILCPHAASISSFPQLQNLSWSAFCISIFDSGLYFFDSRLTLYSTSSVAPLGSSLTGSNCSSRSSLTAHAVSVSRYGSSLG